MGSDENNYNNGGGDSRNDASRVRSQEYNQI
jgi:hypothetical protein